MKKRLERVHSPQLGRSVSLWCYGHWGQPLVAFPTAAGFAHEWESQSMVEALSPWLDGGRIKLYCPESNVAEAWTRRENDPAWRIQRHMAYERFVVETLVPRVREDCASPGIGIGASWPSVSATSTSARSNTARASRRCWLRLGPRNSLVSSSRPRIAGAYSVICKGYAT